ncbi:MAG: hypothetical protein KDA84_19525 [Planctomycetaceae bacterium]|nr:hypothetical protein [Planctomycetaceae bacterium]
MVSPEKFPKSSESQMPTETDESWEQFTKAFPNPPVLEHDSIYALPIAFIETIKKEIEDFFTDEEEVFEKSLRKSSGGGFFLQAPFGRLFLTEQDDCEYEHADQKWLDLAKRQQKSHAEIEGMLVDEMIKSGRTDEEINQFLENPKEFKRKMRIKQDAYAGWLVTDAGFRKERDEFCGAESNMIRNQGLPFVPRSFMGNSPFPVPPEQPPFYDRYLTFYRRWGLERLVTWEVPIPLQSEFLDYSLYHIETVRPAGVVIFVPYYVLRERSLTIYDVARHKMLLERPTHLEDWLEGEKNWGFDRYATMFQLYVCLELAIKRRYKHRLRGNISKLDLAFARYQMGVDAESLDVSTAAETIKKIRNRMEKRLRQSL